MTDEVSVSFKVSITVMFAAGLLSSTLGILVMGLQLLNGYSDKYHSTVSQVTGGGISAIVAEGSAPMPLIYSAVDESINLIDVLILTKYDKSTDTYSGGYDEQTKTYWGSYQILYKYTQNTTEESYMVLLTEYRTSTAHVKSVQSPSYTGMQIITVGVDE